MGLAYMRISVVVNKTRFIPELFFCVFVFLYLYLCTFLSVFVLVKGRYVQLCRSLVYYGSHSERVQIRDSLSALLILLLPTADQMFLPHRLQKTRCACLDYCWFPDLWAHSCDIQSSPPKAGLSNCAPFQIWLLMLYDVIPWWGSMRALYWPCGRL